MLPIDSFVNELIGRKSCASKGSYCWDLPDELAGILCTIILFGTLRGRSPSPLRFFPKTCFGKIHSILVTHFVVMNFSFFHSHGCSIFSLMDFNLPRVTGRFQFTFKFIWITCCQVKKQVETGEKIVHALGEKYFHPNNDAKECKHCTSPFTLSHPLSYHTDAQWKYLASMGHVLYAELSVEKFKWLITLIKSCKKAVHWWVTCFKSNFQNKKKLNRFENKFEIKNSVCNV